MTPTLSLAHLTVLGLAPPAVVDVAARTGYGAVGLRLIAVTPETPGYPLMDDPAGLRATRERLDATGLRVTDVEFVKITPEIDVAALEPFVAAGAALGAGHVVAAPYDPDLGRLSDRLGQLADLCARYRLGAVLEFFTWTVVDRLSAARALVEATARPNLGVLVDALHFARSPSTLDELAALPPSLVPFAHLCDAPAGRAFATEELLHTARAERLPPGEGALDLERFVARLPPGTTLELEVPMERLTREAGPEAVARRVREATTRLLGA